MAESLYPPHSRLYVTCDRDMTEEELFGAFQFYGHVVNVNLCRDRNTGQPKGFAFIQYDKTSQAAAAIEHLNGSTIGHGRPMKVTVALTKEQSGSGSPQFLRLFLVVPKTATENDLYHYFSKFGEIDSINIVKNRDTKESKGYAYVKYKKFVDAAKAYENCDSSYKVVFAKPKEAQQGSGSTAIEPNSTCAHIDDNPDGYTCLKAIVPACLSDEQIEWVFDIPPGLDFVRFFNEPPFVGPNGRYVRKILAHYENPGTAAYALRKLDGFEYPPGDRIIVKPEFQSSEKPTGADPRGQRGGTSSTHSTTELMQQVELLTNSLAEANRLLKSAGLYTPIVKDLQQVAEFRCSARLPPPQPLAPPNSVAEERLFLVCEPGLPPQDALWDVFGRFGNLIDLYILNGKNCGYAKYASRASAHRAIQALNGQDLYRMKMKVLVAEPHKEDRKRPKFTDY